VTRGTPVEGLLAEAFEQLELGLTELRELAQGIHPAVLAEHGLAVALEGLAARATVPVELRVMVGRLAREAHRSSHSSVLRCHTCRPRNPAIAQGRRLK
jgi:hypothetical protein